MWRGAEADDECARICSSINITEHGYESSPNVSRNSRACIPNMNDMLTMPSYAFECDVGSEWKSEM